MNCCVQESTKREAAHLKEVTWHIFDVLSIVIYQDQSVKCQNLFFGTGLGLKFYWLALTNTIFIRKKACTALAYEAKKLGNSAKAPNTKVYKLHLGNLPKTL